MAAPGRREVSWIREVKFTRSNGRKLNRDFSCLLHMQLDDPEPRRGRPNNVWVEVCHSNDSQLFRDRAATLRTEINRSAGNVRARILDNAVQPGTFTVRVIGRQNVIQLLGMQPPYERLVNLNVVALAEAILTGLANGRAIVFEA